LKIEEIKERKRLLKEEKLAKRKDQKIHHLFLLLWVIHKYVRVPCKIKNMGLIVQQRHKSFHKIKDIYKIKENMAADEEVRKLAEVISPTINIAVPSEPVAIIINEPSVVFVITDDLQYNMYCRTWKDYHWQIYNLKKKDNSMLSMKNAIKDVSRICDKIDNWKAYLDKNFPFVEKGVLDIEFIKTKENLELDKKRKIDLEKESIKKQLEIIDKQQKEVQKVRDTLKPSVFIPKPPLKEDEPVIKPKVDPSKVQTSEGTKNSH